MLPTRDPCNSTSDKIALSNFSLIERLDPWVVCIFENLELDGRARPLQDTASSIGCLASELFEGVYDWIAEGIIQRLFKVGTMELNKQATGSAQHFCNRLDPVYLQLKNVLDESDPAHAEVLNNIMRRFREEMRNILIRNPPQLRQKRRHGSGVLADQVGLDREELVRLAKKRLAVVQFDRTRLSKDGYLVKIEEQDVRLPSGEIVLDGTDFRNGAHLRFKADLFVPCGGRPEAVNISNMAALFDSEGKPNFKYIVEGANLFLTQQARLFLEKREVVVFKDSSTNKGYRFSFRMRKLIHCVQNYVKDIQEKITENTVAEFHCLWKEHARLQGAKPRTTISDEPLSMLNNLQAGLECSDLFEDVPSRNGVMRRAIPKGLFVKIRLETLLKRLPEAVVL
ncbi:NAD(P)-binding protein [Gymnopus androsaceus JB14]|uniref:NAD(P)-binding protein n=1 Tax=Gymnopus androsaceus JB14 TaxID=1447944 RepID=A0A6A4HEW7_9AGAR|nr:NAD(P)-binding protein [Gymnopus androsaceus JB14]